MVETRTNILTYETISRLPTMSGGNSSSGELIMIASPNTAHQRTISKLHLFLGSFVRDRRLGEVFIAPYDVVLSNTNVLQPDLLFVATDKESIITAENIKGTPSLVVEVISPSTSTRDREVKRDIYAEHGVGEYWLVDPYACTVSVMALKGGAFQEVGAYGTENVLTSPTLPDLSLDLREIFQSP